DQREGLVAGRRLDGQLDLEARRHGEALGPDGLALAGPGQVLPGPRLAVLAQDAGLLPFAVVEAGPLPALGAALCRLPVLVAGQDGLGQADAVVGELDEEPGRPAAAAGLDGQDVLALGGVFGGGEARAGLGGVAGADLDAVEPDAEGPVGGDVELGLFDGAADVEGAAEVARFGGGLLERVALVVPDPLDAGGLLGVGGAGRPAEGEERQ